ncbi:TPA: NUMOD4 domain-containing protein [Bacillus paranthracis]
MSEIWKDIEGYEGLYQVSNLGSIKSMPNRKYKSERIKSLVVSTKGYVRVCLSKNGKAKTLLVHRVVAKAFINNPDNKAQVNHINGIKTDNRKDNLEWVSLQDNNKHAHKNGLIADNSGSKNGLSKLTEENVIEIRRLYSNGDISQSKLAKRYGVAQSLINRIIVRKLWTHI